MPLVQWIGGKKSIVISELWSRELCPFGGMDD
jgi:hypothetical protein